MIKNVLTTTTIIAIAAVGATSAGTLEPAPAEPVVMAPPPAPMDTSGDWGGFYVGAQLGYGFGEADNGAATNDFDGLLGGLFAGYNWDLGNFVLGLEGDYNLADLQFDGDPSTIDQIARIKLRGGYDMGRTLIYAVGGAAYANATDTGIGDLSDWGWALGAGADYQFTDRWVGGIEYLYHSFDDFDSTGVDIDAHTIAARVSMRF